MLWIDRPFNQPGHGFWAKLEGHNPGGIKDRPALHIVGKARERGLLAPGAAIVESSSGTFALGLALAGALFGHPIIIVSDPGLEPGMRRLLHAYGATVAIADRPHPTGGWQQARRDLVAKVRRDLPHAWCPNQYDNPDNADAYTPLADELHHQLGGVDVLVCSVGTGGHSAGIATALRWRNPELKLIGVDTIGSVLFGQPDRPRLMRGLGSSIHPANVRRELFDQVHWVAPAEAVWACRQLAAAYCVTGGWSVGAVALAAGWAARAMPGTRIAAVFPDGPHRYLDTIFNDTYCRKNRIHIAPPHEPDQIDTPAQREVTRWTRCNNLLAGMR